MASVFGNTISSEHYAIFEINKKNQWKENTWWPSDHSIGNEWNVDSQICSMIEDAFSIA